jgi:amino acid adenylation domain-containing protein
MAIDTREAQEALYARALRGRPAGVEIPRAALVGSIVDRFATQVRAMPDQVVVRSPSGALTYAALDREANRVAHAILDRLGPGPGPVGLVLGHDIPMVVALLAVLKAGKYYVPLDPSFPDERLAFMREDAGVTLLVTGSRHAALAARLADAAAPPLDLERVPAGVPDTDPGVRPTPDHYAYLLYTSGSTGQPKGVIENHRDVLHFARVMGRRDGIGPGAMMSGLFSFSFSGMASNLYLSLLAGGTLVLLDLAREGVGRLAEWIEREAITHLSLSPQMVQEVVAPLPAGFRFSSLRFVRLGTATIERRHVELVQQHVTGDCLVQHSYGASELKHIASYAFAQDAPVPDDPLPLGYDVEDTEVLILRADGSPAGPGEPGEIVARSPFVCPGYWRRPELTAQRFTGGPNGSADRCYRTGDLGYQDAQGCLFFAGRKDFQVKIRGYLVAPQDVETALGRLAAVRACAVTARRDPQGETYLAAYVVPAEPGRFSGPALRREVAALLPPYMVPAAWVPMARLPLTPNGKLDRQALPEPTALAPAPAPASARALTATEQAVARVWGEVLRCPPVGADVEFLDVGGDSLKAARLLARLEADLEVRLPFAEFFDASTVSRQAALIERVRARG